MFSCVQAEVVTIEDQAAQQTPQNNNETEAKKVMRVNAITEIPFGNPEYKNQPIEI